MMRLILIPLFLLLTVSCATTRSGRIIAQGEASWYGPGFHGRQTANGETYNQNDLTAAHRTLPFGTVVRVINLDNGKSVIVRINDRGPYAKGRIIDLSREAARRVELIDTGVAPVRLMLVSSKDPIRMQGTGSIMQEEFTIQLASYNRKSDAQAYSNKIQRSNVVTGRVGGRRVYRVYYGRYLNKHEATRDLKQLQQKGYEGFVKQIQN